jgi:hypothetical protein
MDVAIAFAVSWKPFVKSKTSAVTTTSTTTAVMFMYGAFCSSGNRTSRPLRSRVVRVAAPHTGGPPLPDHTPRFRRMAVLDLTLGG